MRVRLHLTDFIMYVPAEKLSQNQIKVRLRLLFLAILLVVGVSSAFLRSPGLTIKRDAFYESERFLTTFEYDLLHARVLSVSTPYGQNKVREFIVTPHLRDINTPPGDWIRWFVYDDSVVRFSLNDGIKRYRNIVSFEASLFDGKHWVSDWKKEELPLYITVSIEQKGRGNYSKLIFISKN